MRKNKLVSKPGSDLAESMIKIRDEIANDAEATEELHRRIVAIGSATEDNLNCVNHIEIGEVKSLGGPLLEWGPKIKGKNIAVSDIIGDIEGTPIPETIRERFPRLTIAEWNASLRYVTLLLSSLQKETWAIDEK